MAEPLPQGSVVGILGGGQLGRMLSVAAARLGYRCHIYEPAPSPPAADVAWACTTAGYDDAAALEAFAAGVDVVTYEFENVPAAALDRIEAHCPIRPGRRALAVSQDRLDEKRYLAGLGLALAPFAALEGPDDLAAALAITGLPAILKTRRLGYDGKGQLRIATEPEAAAALATLRGAPAVLEGFVPFTAEISVIAARGLDGRTVSYDPGENRHEGGILRHTRVPAGVPDGLLDEARRAAARVLDGLGHVGVLGVEFFVAPQGLLINEIAPRVHNSGHWTQAGCAVDQFEQHIRAIAGWPLGSGARHADVEMINLVGEDLADLPRHAADPAAAIHLYGKAEARPGRKMGHVNRILRAAR